MAGVFNGSSCLKNTAITLPTTGYPLTIGCWFYPTAIGNNQYLTGLTNTSTTKNEFYLKAANSAGKMACGANAGSDVDAVSSASTANSNWYFIVGRWISATNRWLSVILPAGTIEHVQNTTSTSPTGMVALTIGCHFNGDTTPVGNFTGRIGEIYFIKSDIWGSTGTLTDDFVRHLAFNGPFSIPHVADKLVDYRSLRVDPTLNDPIETYYPGAAPTWTNVSSATIGAHVPLPYSYIRPGQNLSNVMM